MSAPVTPTLPAGRHDAGLRRRSTRQGRQRGCSIYIAADELLAAGIDPYGEPPLYRVWAGRKRSVLVALYPQPAPPADNEGATHAA